MIRKTIIGFVILIMFSFVSCNKVIKERTTVFTYKMCSDTPEIKDTLYLSKNIRKIDGRKFEFYNYPEQDSSFMFVVQQVDNQHNEIIYFEDTCKLIDSKLFKLQNKEIEIFKYNYDRKNSEDEESFVYYNPEIGLICVSNFVWCKLFYLEYESTIGLRKVFISDTTGFVGGNMGRY